MTKYCSITSDDLDNIIQDIYTEFINRNLYKPDNPLGGSKKNFYAYITNKFIVDNYAQIDLYVENKRNVAKSVCVAIENTLSTYGYGYVVTVTDNGRWITYQFFNRYY